MENREARNLRALYPEIGAGGFTRVDGSVEFYTRINALLRPDMVVLDIGAGRGSQLLDEQSPYRARLSRIQGKVAKLVGADVDAAVLENPFLDEAHVIDGETALPFADGTFDLVYADWVLEHVDDPQRFFDEVARVLRPGGWFCARTPNRFGVTGLAANVIPNKVHAMVLARLQPEREEQDVFPTRYRCNTLGAVRRCLAKRQWGNFSYIHNPEPPYVHRSRILLTLLNSYFRLSPDALATNLHVFVKKSP